jgi:hypothetical protein
MVNEMGLDSDWVLQVDIASFFASIGVGRLNERLHEVLGKSALVSVIAEILRTHDALTTRSGIPQRSFASSALAHVYLRPLDDAMMTAMKRGAGVVRWMDVISAVGSEERMLRMPKCHPPWTGQLWCCRCGELSRTDCSTSRGGLPLSK